MIVGDSVPCSCPRARMISMDQTPDPPPPRRTIPRVLHQRIRDAASANCAGLQNVIAGFRPSKAAILERELRPSPISAIA